MRRIVILFLVLAAGPASAESVVLAVDGKDIYVDVGAKDGVGAGSELELLHEISAKDPRTGKVLKDRFALGTITVMKSGTAVSVARAEEALAKRVLAGDQVRLVSEKRAFVDPWAEQVAASKVTPVAPPPSGATPDHANLARQAWQDTLGQPLAKRIERWQKLLDVDPTTTYRKAIEAEIANLKKQIEQRELALAKAQSTDERDPRVTQLVAQLTVNTGVLIASPIERAVPGRPIELAFLARTPAKIRDAWLYARPSGAPGFSRIQLQRTGDAYLRGTIDGSLVRGDRVEWYVEVATGKDNDSEPVLGSQPEPMTIEIDRIVDEPPIEEGRTHIDGHVDYVDFDGGFNKGYDQYTQVEADFMYRFLKPVYSVRLGFGSLTGTGGPKDVIDEDPNHTCRDNMGTGDYRCAHVSFSYVYTEVEVRIRPTIAVMVRPQAGLLTSDSMDTGDDDRCQGADVAGCRFLTGWGARGRVRFGEELGTNLVLGAAFTSNVGTLLEAAYHWLPHRVVPVQITVQVTNQPVVEDLGVRLIADVGWRSLSWFYPSVRASYQARDIDHSGFSGGFALNFDW